MAKRRINLNDKDQRKGLQLGLGGGPLDLGYESFNLTKKVAANSNLKRKMELGVKQLISIYDLSA